MKTLIKNGKVINVFTCEIEKKNILIEDDKIIGVGNYTEADEIIDAKDLYLCPGFIDGHIHVESTMLLPYELSKACIPHGTTGIVCDPHEIANVCGIDGINFMLQASKDLPMDVYFMIPSCVPATKFDESGAILEAKDIREFYSDNRVLGLAEVMNYVGVVNGDKSVLAKIKDAQKFGKIINGHAPMLNGADLDKYISAGVMDDHECTDINEAKEKISKGQRIMIRQGTAARNLEALLPLFEFPWADRCLLVTDDKHPYDLLTKGHIDDIIRSAVKFGKDPIIAIRMATLGACEAFNLKNMGAIAPGYKADILAIKDLKNIKIEKVIKGGKVIFNDNKLIKFFQPKVSEKLINKVTHTFNISPLTEKDFIIPKNTNKARIINVIKGELLTKETHICLDFEKNNGIDIEKDILKIAVCERHKNTNHKGIGFVSGLGLKCGAIASSISHDSHNLIIVGTNEKDMAFAGNAITEMGGGCVVVKNGKIVSKMELPIAGLMTTLSAEKISKQNLALRTSVQKLGVAENIEPFMNMAFISLPVIPNIKMTPKGLIDVIKQEKVSLFVNK